MNRLAESGVYINMIALLLAGALFLQEAPQVEAEIQKLSEALKLAPLTADLYAARAALFLKLGKTREATLDLEEAIRLRPDRVEYRAQLAKIGFADVLEMAERGENPGAALDRAIAGLRRGRFQSDEDACIQLGLLLITKADFLADEDGAFPLYWEAKGHLDQAWTLNRNRAQTYVLRARAYLPSARFGDRDARLEAALGNIVAAIRCEPREGSHFLLRARIRLAMEKPELASEDYDTALSLGRANLDSIAALRDTLLPKLERFLAVEKDEKVVARLKALRGRIVDTEKRVREVEPEVANLVAALGADEARERVDAHARILAIGEPALPTLAKFTKHDDAEVRARVAKLVETIQRRVRY